MNAMTWCASVLLSTAATIAPRDVAAQALPPTTGVFPDSSVYWDGDRPGEGMFLEIQGTRASFIIFSYNVDGSQLFYTGGGDIFRADGGEQRLEGYFPVHYVQSALYETTNGPVFPDYRAAGFRPYETAEVGSIRITFGTRNTIKATITLTGTIPPDLFRTSDRFYTQFAFGLPTIGTSTFVERTWCVPNLSGEWVFVDTTDPARVPWRFDFELVQIEPDPALIQCGEGGRQILVYRDAPRAAELRCVASRNGFPDPFDGLQKDACELRLNGASDEVFWFDWQDASLNGITASLGSYPGPAHQRTPARVVGMRVR
jgi:hypothetical protein